VGSLGICTYMYKGVGRIYKVYKESCMAALALLDDFDTGGISVVFFS
jgi:hypothetical protein